VQQDCHVSCDRCSHKSRGFPSFTSFSTALAVLKNVQFYILHFKKSLN